MDKKLEGFIDFFKKIPDHRIQRRKLYCVEEILLLTFCGVILGCDMAGEHKKVWGNPILFYALFFS
ncbi:transposase family protein [Candidatus Regiella endosymbiont of Tuberolachnus salignus]|uniref:transposase family protein n=1 Tax=Candidatus Regiella endosymbiont of Tuberolachnus salignus TaxID=3077956 RepID=UPI0030D206D7